MKKLKYWIWKMSPKRKIGKAAADRILHLSKTLTIVDYRREVINQYLLVFRELSPRRVEHIRSSTHLTAFPIAVFKHIPLNNKLLGRMSE
jgi:hypothetical protein